MKLATWISSGVVQTRTHNSQFSMCSGNFLLDKFPSPSRGITWSLQGALHPQLLSLGPWLVSDVQWTQSCHWVDKLLAPYTHLHKRTCPSWCGKTTKDRLEHFWSTTNITSPTFRLSVVSLHFLWVLRVAPRNYQLDEEIVKKWPGLKLGQNKALCALVTKSLV